MKPREKGLTQKRVRHLFSYNPATGELVWKNPEANSVKPGDSAGGPATQGYYQTKVGGKAYMNHRLIWLYAHGYFPEYGIDHINRNPADNRLENLREVTQICNMRNVGTTKSNKSGVKGVCWQRQHKLWSAYITVNRKRFHLGHHDSFDDAVCARLAAEQCLGWSGCDSNSPAYRYVERMLGK